VCSSDLRPERSLEERIDLAKNCLKVRKSLNKWKNPEYWDAKTLDNAFELQAHARPEAFAQYFGEAFVAEIKEAFHLDGSRIISLTFTCCMCHKVQGANRSNSREHVCTDLQVYARLPVYPQLHRHYLSMVLRTSGRGPLQ